ncbi:YifB family Mg chelatase-like AAA ATPase [Clostridiales bacterium F-3ap]|uniref:YifB family Mg chelatase-like AAA ATPase n=1 Tax=Anaerotalea alkaliphila TaxID=2662126 RepID=A0A7X5HWN3_9FIRM|nr:YifB family Mg chelatase-like AAA ATPase [Anaerotalea alkaliphila]
MTHCFNLEGVEAGLVDVQAKAVFGKPSLTIIGMGDKAIREAGERIYGAIHHAELEVPKMKVVVNLAPGNVRKKGSHFDLAIAVAILHQCGQVASENVHRYAYLGELSLTGRLRPVDGVISMAMEARRQAFEYLILPRENMAEAALVEGVVPLGFESLGEVASFLEGQAKGYDPESMLAAEKDLDREAEACRTAGLLDFSDVRGQDRAVRYSAIAAAGGHNLLLVGAPGCGKSMIAQRIHTILPTMSEEERLEVTRIQSVCGELQVKSRLAPHRPFRAPHHNISTNAMIGGGTQAMPGEVTKAHNGVLFLDEFPEYGKAALESLRQPLEDRQVTVARVGGTHTYPASFMLVAAMNPCPCGHHGTGRCTCTPRQVRDYTSKLSGPLLDRFDMLLQVESVEFLELTSLEAGMSSQELQIRVEAARKLQQERFAAYPGIHTNAQMPPQLVERFCRLEKDCGRIIQEAWEQERFSARTYKKLLRVARTCADMGDAREIRARDIRHALQGFRP